MKSVSIVIPVYNITSQLERLLVSIEKFSNDSLSEVVLVNDKPSDTEVESFLNDAISKLSLNFKYLKNSENLGFVCTVNRGINEASTESDVLILNSDTEVYEGFLDNLVEVRKELEDKNLKWGSLTPFSNAATLASIPVMHEERVEFRGIYSPESAAKICNALFHPDELLEVPTGVGFCMFLSREALSSHGAFLEEFSPGYGEEVEWCLRTNKDGYYHFVVPKIFVFHEGGGSFSDKKQALIERATKIILQRYPDYLERVEAFTNAENSHRYHSRVKPFVSLLEALEDKKIEVLYGTQPDKGSITIMSFDIEELPLLDLYAGRENIGTFSPESVKWLLGLMEKIGVLEYSHDYESLPI